MMSSSSFSYGWKYDVFLSFRGSDTRHGFTGHLYKALCDRGIHTFIDDEELQRGEEITRSLLKAIEESRIAIIVFSKNYACSTFCLDELVHIIVCANEKGRLVLPVFHEVDPSHVRHQSGGYEEAFNKHKERFNDEEKLHKWRIALRKAADLSGYHFKHGKENEYDFIGEIVKEVSQRINRTLLHVADKPVGLESRVLQVTSLLDYKYDRVGMIGIHGIGGLGKTTLARAIYNLIANQFQEVCFLDNVRENSNKHGLVHLQEKLLSKLVGGNSIKLGSVNEGIPEIKHRLYLKKVLLVLDDVDNLDQLQATVGGTDWFGIGSRVIITTRDKHLLKCHGVKNTYEIEGLNKEQALQLLSWVAFKVDKVDPCYEKILNRVVTYACGLPLALEIIGSNLFGKSIKEWESAMDQYERIPNKKIHDILKVSFDSLEEDEQNIFLDIACCFKGYALTYVREILFTHHGFCPEYGIGVLIDKSLINVDSCNNVTLHDLIEDMGKEIVRQEWPRQPGKRSRLWFAGDIVKVLEENKGTSRIEMIVLDYLEYNGVVEWDGMAFKEMNNLKTLIIRSDCFTEGPIHLPNTLRVLEWKGYPLSSLPTDFHPKQPFMLKFPSSCLMSLDVLVSKKIFVKMRVLNFNDSQYITEIPDLSGVPNLEELSFCCCENLIKIHGSVGFLDKLKILAADGCCKLRSFPPIKLTSLTILRLSHCLSLESFPKILGKMENITDLCIDGTPIKELPLAIQNLTNLQKLELVSCENLEQIRGIPLNLETFIVKRCSSLKDLDLTLLSTWYKECHFLKELRLHGCKNLQNIKGISLCIEVLSVEFCTSLKEVDLNLPPECTQECSILSTLVFDSCSGNLLETNRIPSIIRNCSARDSQSLTSICTSMLLKEELDKVSGCKLPRRILEWFEQCINGSSISFSCHSKFPMVSFSVIAGPGRYLNLGPISILDDKKHLLVWEFHFSHVGTDHVALDKISHHTVSF